MLPTQSDLHVNTPLTNLSIAYFQDAKDFVAGQVFPFVPSAKQSDRYYVYDRGDFFRNKMKKRAPGTESAGGGWRTDNTPNFFCDEYAQHKDIPDSHRGNADPVINLDRDATRFLAQQAMLNMEIEWAADFFASGKWASSVTPATKWNETGGDPIGTIDTAKDTVKQATGFEPNIVVLGREAFNAAKNNDDVLDRIKYTQRGVVTTEMLAGLFGVDKVLVANAVKTTSAEGAATDTFDFIAGKQSALVVYANPTPSILMPSGGYIFTWTGRPGAGPQGQRIKRFRMEKNEADRVEIQQNFDMKQVAADLGYFLVDVVA